MIEIKSGKQSEIYEFIKNQVNTKGYPPSVREICEAVNLSSTSTVHGHLTRLEKKGLIRRDPTKPRAIELLQEPHNKKEMINIPIIGKVTAGIPILAQESIEDYLTIPLDFVNSTNELFILKVQGDSMIEAGIHDKDLAIIEKTSIASNGDIVVALLEDSVTVKTFYKEKGFYRLQPENDFMDPIIVEDVMILGIVIGLFRMFQ